MDIGTVCTLFVKLSSSSGEFHRPLPAPATKRPCDETAGDAVFPRRNGRRRSVPATKWLATKCPRDEMAGDEVYPRRNGGDETATTKLTSCSVIGMVSIEMVVILSKACRSLAFAILCGCIYSVYSSMMVYFRYHLPG